MRIRLQPLVATSLPNIPPDIDPDFTFIVQQAVKAPSGHNTQPWLFKITDSGIDIFPDFDRSLPVVDPDNRELFISLGCALENLCLAAQSRGYTPDVEISEAGAISVRLAFAAGTGGSDNPLAAEISKRQTNRSLFNGRSIPVDTTALIGEFLHRENIPARLIPNGSPEFSTIRQFVERGNRIQMRDGLSGRSS
ncbi:MAG: hypothetical protein LUE10_04145 [Alistipes sp.]|nr:hypothetical protein [Alistipes sp.]